MSINEQSMSDLPIGKSFEDPSHESQYIFRQILKSMSEPGRIVTLNTQIVPPPPLSIATVAICLSLLDFETKLWIDSSLDTDEAKQYLKFHTGLKITDQPQQANFCILGTQIPNLNLFNSGTEDYPENGATLIIQTDEITDQAQLQLEGPGIETSRHLSIGSINKRFWANRDNLQSLFPRGLDFIFTQNDITASLPRTTNVTVLKTQLNGY